jgi:hypothetical protein
MRQIAQQWQETYAELLREERAAALSAAETNSNATSRDARATAHAQRIRALNLHLTELKARLSAAFQPQPPARNVTQPSNRKP